MGWIALWYLIGTGGTPTTPPPVVSDSDSVLPATATIVFQLPTTNATASGLGLTAPTEPLIVVAFLKRGKGEYTAESESASDRATVPLAGYSITPKFWPKAIQPEQSGECILWRIDEGTFELPSSFESKSVYDAFVTTHADRIVLQGDFFWEANVVSGFEVEEELGDRLKGDLMLRSAWADAL